MSDQPPPYEPRSGMPSFGRLLNRLILSLGVQDEQLRPDTSYVNRVLSAANDIRICEKIFDGWASHLAKVRGEKPDEQERQVRHYVDCLMQDTRHCSETLDKILWCHARFAGLMAQQIDGATKSRPKAQDGGMDAKVLANYISTTSRSLSQDIAKMNGDLELFVSYLGNIQVKQKKKKSILRRIFGGLKLLFKALAGIFALGAYLGPLLKPVVPGVDLIAPAASALSIAVAKLCEMADKSLEAKEAQTIESVLLLLKNTVPKEIRAAQQSLERFDATLLLMRLEKHMTRSRLLAFAESLEAKEAQTIESVLLFLKNTVPKETRAAQQSLKQFDATLLLMRLEKHMTGSRLPASARPKSAAIAQEWRDVAKRYQSVLLSNV